MALRNQLPARNVNGELTSPDVRFPARIDASRYTLQVSIEAPTSWADVTKSLSVFIEWLDEAAATWVIWGGGHWRGGVNSKSPLTPRDTFTVRTWEQDVKTGVVTDRLNGKRVRLRAVSPAIDPDTGQALFPGTSGPVRASVQILDERAT